MKRDLKEKIAWIVGAGSGIGQNAAVKLSSLGMKVILSGRNIKNSNELKSIRNSSNFIFEIHSIFF